MEALVRWHHPNAGCSPPEFIPLAEQSYLIRELTFQVVELALAQAAQWWRDGLPVQISLNVSARDLLDTGLAQAISDGLKHYGLPPEVLLLEINERVLTSESAHAAAAVDALAALGVALSLDDFGTGPLAGAAKDCRAGESFVFVGRCWPPPTTRSTSSRSTWSRPRDRLIGRGRGVGGRGGVAGERLAAGLVLQCPLNAASATTRLAEHGICGAWRVPRRRLRSGRPQCRHRRVDGLTTDGPGVARAAGSGSTGQLVPPGLTIPARTAETRPLASGSHLGWRPCPHHDEEFAWPGCQAGPVRGLDHFAWPAGRDHRPVALVQRRDRRDPPTAHAAA
jgi:hypothetical protein